MDCPRCKTVELIRIHFPPTHRLGPSDRPLAAYVDRCPCCMLQWAELPDSPRQPLPLPVTRTRQRELLQQEDLFTAVVGGFALF